MEREETEDEEESSSSVRLKQVPLTVRKVKEMEIKMEKAKLN